MWLLFVARKCSVVLVFIGIEEHFRCYKVCLRKRLSPNHQNKRKTWFIFDDSFESLTIPRHHPTHIWGKGIKHIGNWTHVHLWETHSVKKLKLNWFQLLWLNIPVKMILVRLVSVVVIPVKMISAELASVILIPVKMIYV